LTVRCGPAALSLMLMGRIVEEDRGAENLSLSRLVRRAFCGAGQQTGRPAAPESRCRTTTWPRASPSRPMLILTNALL